MASYAYGRFACNAHSSAVALALSGSSSALGASLLGIVS